MIKLCGVSKTYNSSGKKNSVKALVDINLEINEPGFYAIMGPSGSGKSTLLHLMAGLDRADCGEISIGGNNIHEFGETELTRYRRLLIGVIFQKFNLIPTMDAISNVALPAILDHRPVIWARQRAEQLLDMLGMADRIHHRPDALSGGEQQRLAIARALVFEPAYIFADEPTGNIDSQASEQIWQMLHELAYKQDITVIMVTHEPAGAAFAREVFVICDGMIREHIEVGTNNAGWLATRYQQSQCPVG